MRSCLSLDTERFRVPADVITHLSDRQIHPISLYMLALRVDCDRDLSVRESPVTQDSQDCRGEPARLRGHLHDRGLPTARLS